MTCIFLATKVENNFAREGHFDSFAKKVPKWPTLDEMLELEFALSKGIRFDLKIQHPYLSIDGLFLDLQVLSREDCFPLQIPILTFHAVL